MAFGERWRRRRRTAGDALSPSAAGERRAQALIDAGFARPLAIHIAYEGDVEPRVLLELTTRGCPPWLAARILDPLDGLYPEELDEASRGAAHTG